MVKRSQKHVIIPKSREDVEKIVGFISQSMIERDRLVNEMERRIQAIRDEYVRELARIAVEIDGEMAVLKLWAELNRAEFEGEKKSLEFTHGTIGFRVGNWQIRTLRKLSLDDVLANMKGVEFNEMFREHIREKEEIDRERLIADREKLAADALESIGIRIVQTESFFCEPKREEVTL
jgi:phage host-nuclease inhibitor protein Gam